MFDHGFLILDKPLGLSSAAAVAQVKKILRCKKIGHGGTLDPLASGILPLAINEATKAISYVQAAEKSYRFTVTFGEQRDTDDAEGQVVARTDHLPSEQEILDVLPELTGEIMQLPPVYSALKIAGQRAYALARAGEEVPMTARPVSVYFLALSSCGVTAESQAESTGLRSCAFAQDDGKVKNATFEVRCGKGTYVRSLARDIALKCNSLAYVSMLRRTAVGKFTEKQAISLDKLADFVHTAAAFEAWVPIELALDDIPAINVDTDCVRKLRQGQSISSNISDGTIMVLHQGHIVALAETVSGTVKPVRVFNVNL